jgi:UDP-N-acetylmuramate dehydrogenase
MIAADFHRALSSLLEERVAFDVPLARHTALRIGGPADAFAEPAHREELLRLLRLCASAGAPHHVLGSGFNTLVLDGGIEGVVIHLGRFRGLEEKPAGALRIEAGVSHAALVNHCIKHGFAGLEFGAGIPGTVGGWIAMNAGIGVREVKDALVDAEVASADGARLEALAAHELRPHYRGLGGLAPGAVIVSTLLRVTPADPGAVRAEVERQRARRAETQPLDLPSCGSVFKNPAGDFAGRLIEAAGLKGLRVGGAEISALHANFILNRGGARAADVLALIERAQGAVRDRFGVTLEPEVRLVGRTA